MRTLDDFRKDIDRVDEVIVRLLNERARVACEIGRLKKAECAGVPAGPGEAGHRTRAKHRRRRAARPGSDRPSFRAHHRRSAAVGAPCGPWRRDARTSGVNARAVEATEAMVVVMEERATEEQIEQVVSRLVEMGMDVHRSTGVTRTVLGAVGQGHPDKGLIEMLEAYEVVRISEPKAREPDVQTEPTQTGDANRRRRSDRHGRSCSRKPAGPRGGRRAGARSSRRRSPGSRQSFRASAKPACSFALRPRQKTWRSCPR